MMDYLTAFFHCIGGLSAAICTALWFFIWAMTMKRHNSISSRLTEVQLQQMRDNVHLRTDLSRLSMILHTQQRRMDMLESQLTVEPVITVPVDKDLLDIMTRIKD